MFRRVASFLRKSRVEQELDDELRASVDLLAEEHIARGVAPQDAIRLARIELGGVEQVKEGVRGVRGLPVLEAVIRDFHHALRNLIRTPGFSIAVVVTLGLALGANASVLVLLDRLILRPLPVKEPGSLVVVNAPPLPERPSRDRTMVEIWSSGRGRTGLSYPLYAALRSRVRAFTGMLAQAHATATMLVEGTPVTVEGQLVTGNYFELLGLKAALADASALPGCNVITRDHLSAKDSFRESVFDLVHDAIIDAEDNIRLLETYQTLLAYKPAGTIACPYAHLGCDHQVFITMNLSTCPCDRRKPLFPTDALRIHERFNDDAGTNGC